MNMSKRWTSLLLAVVMVLALMVGMVSCKDPVDPNDGNTPGDGTTPGTNVTYTVSLKSIGGLPLEGATLYVYEGDNIKGYADTNASGLATFNLPASPSYKVEVTRVPEGYILQDKYDMNTSGTTNIVLTSAPVADSDLTGVSYQLGSILHDFEATLTDGTKWKLSEVLKEKKAVMLNFWYTTCTYCIEEFPGLNAAYEKYKDDIAVIALNAYGADTFEEVKHFKDNFINYYLSYYPNSSIDPEFEMTLPVAKDPTGIQNAFNFPGNPVSVIIDRYGMVSLVHTGGMTERQFNSMFAHYSNDNYTQGLYSDVKQLVPQVKPDVDMPSSEELGAVLNNGDITITYSPETEEADAEYSWPFLITKKDGVDCIVPANQGIEKSFATLYAKVTLKKGQAFVFDYLSSCSDIMYVLVDKDDIYQISGVEKDGWKECCPWVAVEDGTYDVTFLYNKDTDPDSGDDCVYLKNFRVIDAKDVNVASYIPREAATNPDEYMSDYQNYVTVVYNEADGYYHVGTVDGPILLARLIYNTRFSDESVSANLQTNHELSGFMVNDVNRYQEFLKYCNYAANSQIYTYCSVTKELRSYLEAYVEFYGTDTHENTWLQLCAYYDVYGKDENGAPAPQLTDPIKGLSAHSAYIAVEGKPNYVEYFGLDVLPRGYLYRFVPTTSGVYRVTSKNTEQELIGWIFRGNDADWMATPDHDRILHTESDVGERICYELMYEDEEGNVKYDSYNVSMVAYMEAGKEYYIDIAFADVVGVGSFTFDIVKLGETYDYFIMASPGYFTFELGESGAMGDTIAGGIDVMLGEDGYYYHKKEDGSKGSLLYADFYMTTGAFTGESLQNMVNTGAFDFTLSETDHMAIAAWESVGHDEDKLKEKWGEEYDMLFDFYQMEDIMAGKYHGKGKDMTEAFRAYIPKMIVDAEHPEREGCVPVDKELAEILQQLMDKYTFAGVDHSWTKVCFYYDYLGR